MQWTLIALGVGLIAWLAAPVGDETETDGRKRRSRGPRAFPRWRSRRTRVARVRERRRYSRRVRRVAVAPRERQQGEREVERG